jgi:hypothetical protein
MATIFWPKIWQRLKWSIYVWKQVACSCVAVRWGICTGVTGRRQSKPYAFWIMVLLFYCGPQSELGTRSRENREGVITPPPQAPENVLSSVCWVGCGNIMWGDGILRTSISERCRQHDVCVRNECAPLHIYRHLMVTLSSTSHVLWNVHTPFPALPHFFTELCFAVVVPIHLKFATCPTCLLATFIPQ